MEKSILPFLWLSSDPVCGSCSGDAELERRFNGLPYEGSDELAQSDEHRLDERVLSFQEGDDEDEARAYLKRGVIEDEFEVSSMEHHLGRVLLGTSYLEWSISV